MLKVVAVTDKVDTAIDRLARGVAPFIDGFEYDIVSVHPKRPDLDQLHAFEVLAQDADIIDFQYFRTALMLLERYPWLKEKKTTLTHYNPYSITESDWSQFDHVVACNKYINDKLPGSIYIPLTVDTDFWKFNTEWQPSETVIMTANRIESKKGIKEVAQACGELNIKLVLVGSVSDANYFHDVLAGGTVEFAQGVSDTRLRELYYEAGLHICNSVDDFESGTLPILEAMLCGTPVLTRNIGHVPELNSGENMYIFDHEPDDVPALIEQITQIFADKERMQTIREKAWDTAKTRSNERRAYTIQRNYRGLFAGEPVSVIMPIANRPEIFKRSIQAVANQTHPNIELILVDEGDNRQAVEDIKKYLQIPVKYIQNNIGDYGLARARNLGIIEATSDILVFCDERVVMAADAVAKFVENLNYRSWLYGNKGVKKDFVENFSCCYRQELIELGMFNERITEYGGMSQEIRGRIRKNGWQTPYVESATAQLAGKSSNRWQKKEQIIHMKNLLYKMGIE